jgi:23S rRNA A2030 N6-methylase RlmJ
VAMVNPPWKLDEMLHVLLPKLLVVLGQHPAGRSSVFWLASE